MDTQGSQEVKQNESTTISGVPTKTNIPDMGNHLILDFANVSVDLNNFELLDEKLRKVLSKTSVVIEGAVHKVFEPQGVTILYLLSESHFSIHTWPESGSCAIDFYHCGERSTINLKIAEVELCNLFGWENCSSFLLVKRGNVSSYLTNDFIDKTEILKNVKYLHREMTPFQEIRVYDTLAMGRILVLDGAVQIASNSLKDDNYTKDITRFNITKDKSYDHIIIIGGGDLVIAAHLFEEYPLIKKITVCEIDERVIEVTKKFFSFAEIIDKELVTGRLEVVIKGGAEYMDDLLSSGKQGKIGSVVIDCTDFALDENSIAAELFTPRFYRNIYDLLEDGGAFSQQITKIFYKDAFTERVRSGGFDGAEFIMSSTPEYGGELPLAIVKKSIRK
jgi:spermidine synthase